MQRLLLWTLLLASGYTYAQKNPLTVGKPFPYSEKFVISYPESRVRSIEDFRGKYLLLVLFGSECIQNFKYLPGLDSLSKKHKDHLTVLHIGRKDHKIEDMYRKYQRYFNLELEVAFDSMSFQKIRVYFLPTYVWIGEDGLIRGVSDPSELTSDNMSTFLSGNPLPFGSVSIGLSDKTSSELCNKESDSDYLFRTKLGIWNSTIPYHFPRKLAFDSNHFHVSGVYLDGLYRYAYFGTGFWDYGDSLDGKAWLYPLLNGDSVFSSPKKYCFSASYTGTNPPDLRSVLKSNLEEYFGYKGEIVRRSMPYYSVTVVPDKKEEFRTKGEKKVWRNNHARIYLRNVPMDLLIERIAYYNYTGDNRLDIPFIDETGIDFNVDVSFDAILTVRNEFFAALRKIGIIVELKSRIMDVLILTPKESIAIR
ncbi:MAG: hypothetical protein J0L56_09425 [Chitinophagales bacterium]|nr:hypothetical protein [Chitinophagales bacterium]